LTDQLQIQNTSLEKNRLNQNLRWPVATQCSTACWDYIVTMTTLRYRTSGDWR